MFIGNPHHKSFYRTFWVASKSDICNTDSLLLEVFINCFFGGINIVKQKYLMEHCSFQMRVFGSFSFKSRYSLSGSPRTIPFFLSTFCAKYFACFWGLDDNPYLLTSCWTTCHVNINHFTNSSLIILLISPHWFLVY